ncbi:MAG: 4-(cytidine 5'-diphospho)-2-C-methyl-D-erythritol kinase [Candidatus Limnocylindria bacterium]
MAEAGADRAVADGPQEGARWRLAAPAKLNLWLTVVGQRPDGFHELDSLLVLLELADEVSVGPGDAELRISGPAAASVPADRTNLAWRGWAAGLADIGAHADVGDPPDPLHPFAVSVEKHVPAAAGLGGGSSDAAAAWRLARWVAGRNDATATPDELVTLSRIGADVPFFAARIGVARIGGVGERVEPADQIAPGIEQGKEHAVLAHPPFGLATGAVFAELRRSDWSGPVSDPREPWRNDLEQPARRLRTELDDLFRLVAGAGGEPHLTGSGPTVFALTDDPERADGITARLERAGVTATRTRLRPEPASIER